MFFPLDNYRLISYNTLYLNGIESLEQNYKDYLKQVRLYSTFYEKNKHLLETGERNIQTLRKHFSE